MTANQNAAGAPVSADAPKPWWQVAIGRGKMIDTDRFFVISANVPGGSGGSVAPASIDPATGKPYGMRFPVLTVADMADLHMRLLDQMGIDRLHTAIGGCMGGFQVLELARRHPERLARAIPISATPSTSAYTIALSEFMRQAIYADRAWNGGDCYDGSPPLTGLGLTAMIGSVLWLDRDTLAENFGRQRADATEAAGGFSLEFEVESFLARVRAHASARFDPSSLIYMTKAVDLYDLAEGYDSLADGVRDVAMPLTLVSYEPDWRDPPDEIAALARAIATHNPAVTHHHLQSHIGHGAFQFDVSAP